MESYPNISHTEPTVIKRLPPKIDEDKVVKSQTPSNKFNNNQQKSSFDKKRTKYDDSYDIPEELNSKHSGDTIQEIYSDTENLDPLEKNAEGDLQKKKTVKVETEDPEDKD